MIKNTYFFFLPSFGIFLFMLLYMVAAAYYHGGSKANLNATKFSWRHNYWCDLFDVTTYNGSKNPSRNIAIVAMFLLSASFGTLLILVAKNFEMSELFSKVIIIASVFSTLISACIFTSFHEEVINFGGLFGGIALFMIFLILKKNNEDGLFYGAIVCFALCCANYFIYHSKIAIDYLPVLQKITFLAFCIWGLWLNFVLIKKIIYV